MLGLSNDSAYRRIRGETSLTFDELTKLSKRFNISVDSLMESSSNDVVFHYQPLDEESFDFMTYLEYIRAQMQLIASAEDKEVIYMANEIPLFHLMHVPEIAAFKLFFWQKTILDFSDFRNQKFKLMQKDERVNELSRDIRDLYCKIPSTEIYHSETIDTTLKQVEYYFVTGYFEDKREAIYILDKLVELVDHIKHQCEAGCKYKRTEDGRIPEFLGYQKENNYTVFHNEVLHTDNTILVRLGDHYMSFLTSNGISSLSTESENFFVNSKKALEILKRRATIISGTSEKERNRVFESYQRKISKLKDRLKMMMD